jgi:YVTN family beta-propeller protein
MMTRTTDISITDIRNLLGLYVDVTTTNEVVVIDSNNLEIAKRIPTGNAPFWIAVPGNH